ncbi:TIGR03985 family CRISPR-associated protein [Calothrix sp. 336/3]|uniref:TIGR03985 family CRISPR-associated protein n=1 Tax=Calothrix sp. 336/3 TaxID=1337936 RepID=UPI0004E42005|nr:TIGR03985 family CRISPR-associated protein [Calothrix sp. 336/3]AKG20733.1 CRISPR-associated protein, TIGR03985 family [Calothrix sp. 336/3]
MQEQFFLDVPDVELLQWFARGSLKQNLSRAIRLWVCLRGLYGDTQERLPLDDAFTYAEWRDVFFTPNHPKGEAIPELHDVNCNCAKTVTEWLFNRKTGIVAADWQTSLVSHVGMEEEKLEHILQQRLFAVTRRSLQADFGILAELGWLKYHNQKYYRVQEFPWYPSNQSHEINQEQNHSGELKFLQEDLSAIAQNHSQEIQGIQRFFVHLDYVIPKHTIDWVEDWQNELRLLWGKTPVPAVKLTYSSARVGNAVSCIVFPVCIYYVQRAVYLCGYGESPDRKTDWYNFRLDRIQSITPWEWHHPEIPANLRQRYQQLSLPSPDYIAMEMSKAWGFDFYLPSTPMLLRFNRNFSDRYIKGTERHDTFEEITYQQAQRLIKRHITQPQKQRQLLGILAQRSPEDAYYQVFIRYQDSQQRDNNVIMRLRAWHPECEVFLPWDLRQSMAADIAKEFHLYHQ